MAPGHDELVAVRARVVLERVFGLAEEHHHRHRGGGTVLELAGSHLEAILGFALRLAAPDRRGRLEVDDGGVCERRCTIAQDGQRGVEGGGGVLGPVAEGEHVESAWW